MRILLIINILPQIDHICSVQFFSLIKGSKIFIHNSEHVNYTNIRITYSKWRIYICGSSLHKIARLYSEQQQFSLLSFFFFYFFTQDERKEIISHLRSISFVKVFYFSFYSMTQINLFVDATSYRKNTKFILSKF